MSLQSRCCAFWILSAATTLAAAQNIAATQRQQVPNFKGRTLQQVRATAVVPGTHKPLFSSIEPQSPDDAVVTNQDPAANAWVIPGERPLRLTLSSPPATKPPGLLETILQGVLKSQNVKVPNVIGQERAAATQAIQDAHLTPAFSDNGSGRVTLQSLPPQSSVPQGTTITLTCAQQTTVPPVVGKTLADATTALSAASLQVGRVISPATDTTTVVSDQRPGPGTLADLGSPVDLTLTTPATPPQPDPAAGPNSKAPPQKPPPLKIQPHKNPLHPPKTESTAHPRTSPLTQLLLRLHSYPLLMFLGAGLVLVGGVTAAIVHHLLHPPSTAYSLLTRQPSRQTVPRNQPSLRWQLTVRDGPTNAQSHVDREPAITRRSRS